MCNNTLLSIIIPVYNAEKYLKRCIDSVLAQSYQNIEILLVDDGSCDQSPKICEKYRENDSRVRVFHEKNGGPAAARNVGIKNAQGRFLGFVDSDDYLEPFMYSEIIEQMTANDAGMGVCRWVSHEIETNKCTEIDIGYYGTIDARDAVQKIILGDIILGGGFPWNRVIDKERLHNSCSKDIFFPEDIRMYEDKCFVIECLSHLDKMVVIDVLGYHYQIHSGSLTSRSMDEKLLDVVKAWKYNFTIIKEMNVLTSEIQRTYQDNMTNYLLRLKHRDYKEGKELWKSLDKSVPAGHYPLKYLGKCIALWCKYSIL